MLEEEIINGESYVLVPKEAWNIVCDVFDKIDRIEELKWIAIHLLEDIALMM